MATETNMLVSLTAEIVSAHVTHNAVAVSDLPALIANVYASLTGLGIAPPAAPPERQQPAVPVWTSIKPDYIVCLEDGKQMKMLKRHLMTDHQMTPAEYRAKWQLPADYPMVASNYAASRRTLALSFGLGKTRPTEADAAVESPVEATPPPALAEPTPVKAARPKRPRLKIAFEKS